MACPIPYAAITSRIPVRLDLYNSMTLRVCSVWYA